MIHVFHLNWLLTLKRVWGSFVIHVNFWFGSEMMEVCPYWHKICHMIDILVIKIVNLTCEQVIEFGGKALLTHTCHKRALSNIMIIIVKGLLVGF